MIRSIVAVAQAEPVRFGHEVMAVLSKGGCNQGTCHGNQNGKNGFKLSLRGEDAAWDFQALTRDTLGRRINPHRPAESLILLKATATIPHEGGRRFEVGSPEYRLLHQWIAAGARPDPVTLPTVQRLDVTPVEKVLIEPDDQVRLRVHATLSDGTVRDVTHLAVFETSNPAVVLTPNGGVTKATDANRGVMETAILIRYLDRRATTRLAFVPARPEFRWPNVPEHNFIDRHVFTKLKALRVAPSDLCSDSVFLRRAYLDAIGVLPTPDETRGFLNDPRPGKRPRLIDALVQRPEFADHWALKWADLLRNEEKVLDRKGVRAFHAWIRQAIDEGKPLNELARELVAARGSTYTHPPANFYRALRDPQARNEAVAQVFLGLRLQCAKCHNHPFDRWTQEDYHRFSAFFTRVQYRILENNRRDQLDKHEFDGEQVVWMAREGEVKHPHTGQVLDPRFPGTATLEIGNDADRLHELADWIADPASPFFARTQVNRVWAHLLGRGIVDPLDDFRASNPPVNPGLLDALSKDFVAHHFDLRQLVRTIMNSRTYQLSAVPNATNREDTTNFSRAIVRRLPAEPLLDAYAQVLGAPLAFSGYPSGTRAGQVAGVQPARRREAPPTDAEVFLKAFGKPDRLLTCECERSDEATLSHAVKAYTGEPVNRLLTAADNRLGGLLAAGTSDRAILEEFYLAALSRLPNDHELRSLLASIPKAEPARREALEDMIWALVNSKEFLLRQ